jgi:hypothetical protein
VAERLPGKLPVALVPGDFAELHEIGQGNGVARRSRAACEGLRPDEQVLLVPGGVVEAAVRVVVEALDLPVGQLCVPVEPRLRPRRFVKVDQAARKIGVAATAVSGGEGGAGSQYPSELNVPLIGGSSPLRGIFGIVTRTRKRPLRSAGVRDCIR